MRTCPLLDTLKPINNARQHGFIPKFACVLFLSFCCFPLVYEHHQTSLPAMSAAGNRCPGKTGSEGGGGGGEGKVVGNQCGIFLFFFFSSEFRLLTFDE